MQLGMIGLGRMGANMVQRIQQAGHQCVVWDRNPDAVAASVAQGAVGAADLQEMKAKLDAPRSVWVMVPAGVTGSVVEDLAGILDEGDTIIDGGNSYYRDDMDRSEALAAKGIHYVDAGTSGGVFGLERGYCLMIGGDDEAVGRLVPIFKALAPGLGEAERTPGRTGDPAPSEEGWLHCGPPGAGHFVKMVHNGVEYGIMAAYAEGLGILQAAGIGKQAQEHDAETAPMRDAHYYQFDIDTTEVSEVWRRGSVIASWLLDLTAAALQEDPELAQFGGRVSDSGEGRWTVTAAVDEGVPAHTITAALYERFSSRGNAEFSDRVLSAMRKQFGGHIEKPAAQES
jgi:6-phosphogluconate dehydrogenase